MAVDIQFLINGQDRGQPLNAKDFGVSITESVEINARIVTFDNELIFGNDMYTYLFDRLTDTGFCNLVEVEVHYECDGGWVKLTNGYIVLSECSFDLDKCQVKTKLYDDTFSTRINNNKSIPFSLSLTTSKNGNVVIPPRIYNGNFFSPATGLYDYESVGVCPVYLAFKHLVNCMSDGLVDFESSLFYWQEDTSYDSTLIITNGNALRNRSGQETIISFEELYIALKKKLNLGMAFERQANGRPLLRIELESYFYQSNPDVNLYDQPSIQLNFDKERLYQAVNFGSDPFLESEECDNGNTACQFVQTPFRGFRDEIFGFTGECNTSSILDLRTDEVIFDTNVIEDIFQFNVDRYTTNPIIVDAHYFFSSTSYEMNQFDPYGIGQTLYNGDFRNILVSSNWINGYPNSLFSFLTTPFNPVDTDFRALATQPPVQTFQITTAPTFFSAVTGFYIEFATETFDNGNNFLARDYVVPEAGFYTFTAQIIRNPILTGGIGNIEQFITLNHFSIDDVFISSIQGAIIAQAPNSFSLMTVNGSFVCNQGDIIRVDWNAKIQTPPGSPPPQNATIAPSFDVEDTYFEGGGVPFNPLNPDEELDAVAIDDVRAYLYDFERPLTMAEIQLMLDNTSKPVSFGKHDDTLRVIEGFIKKVNIPSITRQKASIELKSNRLLR
jgi:hypothetical protein